MSIFYKEEAGVGTITFDQPDSKVNILSSVTLVALEQMLDTLKTKTLQALIIQSAKKDIFIAGADIQEIESITVVAEGKLKAQAGQRIMNTLEDLPFPTVAVIDGAALGGGCELALACRYRVMTFNDKIRIGLPEVHLGFIPGFGGTYRLPRLVGLRQGLKMIIAAIPISASAALKCGLVDRLYPAVSLSACLKDFIAEISAKPQERIFRRKTLKGFEGFLENNPLGRGVVFKQTMQTIKKVAKGFYPAPLKALEVLRITQHLSREEALEIESSSFAALAVSVISKNLVKVFYLSEKYKKLSIPTIENVTPVPVVKAAVIGAGIMGGGIAQLLSDRGVWARLKDINQEMIAKGLKAAYEVYVQSLKKKRIKACAVHAKMAMISGTVDYSGFANADIVIEAVVENIDIKKKVLAEMSAHISSQAIVASNTSSLSITAMAAVVKNPERVIGFHFFNPVHRMPLIEIITTPSTSEQTLVSALALAKKLGKTPVIVKDAPGFLVNRILLAYINEAGRILIEGASISDVDRYATDFGMPMGPFTLSDEVGLDVGVKVLHVLETGLGARFKPVKIFDEVLAKKFLGKKSGKGFYSYGKERRVNSEIKDLMASGNTVGATEAIERMLYIMINEAAMILEEKIVASVEDVDIGMIMGTGFPAFRGGLLRYADSLGIDRIVEDLIRLESRFQDGRFKPCGYILDLKAGAKSFYND